MEQSRNFPTPIIWFRNLKRIRPIPNLRQQPSKSVKQHSHEEDEIAWNQSGPKVANGTQRPFGPLLPGKTVSYLFEGSIRARPFANAAQPFKRDTVLADVGPRESPDNSTHRISVAPAVEGGFHGHAKIAPMQQRGIQRHWHRVIGVTGNGVAQSQ